MLKRDNNKDYHRDNPIIAQYNYTTSYEDRIEKIKKGFENLNL